MQKAIVIQEAGVAHVVTDAPIPVVSKDFLKIRTVAVALNPSDWKHIDFRADKGAIVGVDYAGYVEEIGPLVKRAFKVGDRVAGFTHGSNTLNHSTGAFAEHVLGKDNVALVLPDNLSFESAASLGAGITTIGLCLYKSLQLPLPTTPAGVSFPVLVYGGSTSTGVLAIQFLKLSGLTVITTCGPHNFDLVKFYGADATFDYNDPECGPKIRAFCNDGIVHVLDTISEGSSAKICADAISTRGGCYTSILAIEFPRTDCKTDLVMAYTAFGEEYKMGPNGPLQAANSEDHDYSAMFFDLAQELLAGEKFRPHQVSIGNGGLHGVLEGLDLLRTGKVSGNKLVYRVKDTI